MIHDDGKSLIGALAFTVLPMLIIAALTPFMLVLGVLELLTEGNPAGLLPLIIVIAAAVFGLVRIQNKRIIARAKKGTTP